MSEQPLEDLESACYSLLSELRRKVAALEDRSHASAMVVMSEVSTFETDWWGCHAG